jgi:thymidylate synthase ThyX
MTLEWQKYSTRLGYDLPDEVVSQGYGDEWTTLMDDAGEFYEDVRDSLGADVAQYVVPFAFNIRFVMEMNPRQAFHLIELRSQPNGHPAYRSVAQQMHGLIRDVAGHRLIADSMRFVDYTDPDLERLEGERRAQKKREATVGSD